LVYAKAVQEGDADSVIAMTLWMQERVERIRLEAQTAAQQDTALEQLKANMRNRRLERNQLGPEGIEDQYIFSAGATLTVAGVDEGRSDLARPAARRVWIRVTYPSRSAALHDANGKAIRAVTVGVNISEDGYVLKAGVLGNLDIDVESLTYDWP
jgi:hypothetical protein